ncbi:hypothetical protein KPL70_022839 [Citrus sinensis]|nr:hypothetical protein KPL70_022839 [Citrus sinensis]
MEITNDKWNEVDGNTIFYLHLALADGVLSSVAEKNTANEIWDTLTKLYKAKSLHNKIFLKRKLYTLRMAESTMVTNHINTLKTLFSQLTMLGHNIEENKRAELLLQSLPDSYDQLIINLINNNPVESLVFDDVAASVLNEESRWKNKKNKQASSQQAEELSVMRGRSTECGPSGSQNHGKSKSRSLKILSEQKSLPGLKSVSLPFCKYCVISKQHRLKFSRSIGRSKCILDLIHSDVWKSPDIFMGGVKYMVTFIDDYSRRCWVYPIKKKSDVFPVFKEYKARVKLESGKKIKCLRTDNGGEYTDGEFIVFYKQEGIQRQFTVAYTPQQNRVTERMNKTLTERIRTMLKTASLPNSFWVEAAKTACYILNRSPSIVIGLKTAMEMWTGKPADYSYLHPFGCPVYVMYNAQERTKLDPKSRRCIFLGYADGVNGYRLWDPTAHKIVISKDVIFIEDQLQRRDEDDSTVKEKSETVPVYVENNLEDSDSSEAALEHEEQESVESEAPEVSRSTRERRPPTWHLEYVTEINVVYYLLTEGREPSTFHEALQISNVTLWMTVILEEIEALHKNRTWELLALSCGRKAVGNKWVYKIKRDGNDQVERYRARLVVKGYAQKECIDFNEIFSPIVRLTTIRIVLTGHCTSSGSEFTVRGYVDSDFAGDLDKRKSTTGYVFTLAGAAKRRQHDYGEVKRMVWRLIEFQSNFHVGEMSKLVGTSQIQVGFDSQPKKMLKILVPSKEKEEEVGSNI